MLVARNEIQVGGRTLPGNCTNLTRRYLIWQTIQRTFTSHCARCLLLGENLQARILLTFLVRVTPQLTKLVQVNVDFFFSIWLPQVHIQIQFALVSFIYHRCKDDMFVTREERHVYGLPNDPAGRFQSIVGHVHSNTFWANLKPWVL